MTLDPSQAERGNAILRRLLAKQGDPDADANDLLACFFRGYPLENLRPLLRSEDPDVAKAGAWIASELGVRAKPLLEDVVPLLGNPALYVRFFAIDSILTCADDSDGEATVAVVRLIADPEGAVRWKVFHFLIRASTDRIASAITGFEQESEFAVGLRQLLQAPQNSDAIRSMLESDSPVIRRLAVAAATRAAAVDARPLRAAATSSDEEIRSWAEEELAQKPGIPRLQ